MKYVAVRVLAAGLLLSGASLIQAQSPEPPHIMRIFREDIKSGKGSAEGIHRCRSGFLGTEAEARGGQASG